MHKISENIYFYKRLLPSSNTSLIKGEPNILIDPGYNPNLFLHPINYFLKKAGLILKDIDELWFTHNHPDHTQLAYYILQEKDMKVVCHPRAKLILETEPPIAGLIELEKEGIYPVLERIYPGRKGKQRNIENLMSFMIQLYGRPLSIGSHAIKVDDTFIEGEERYGIRIIYLPGHTPDEVGFLSDNILISGDLIATFNFKRPAVLNIPSSDIDDTISSLEKMFSLPCEWILPGHGSCVKIDKEIVKGIYEQTVQLRENGIELIKRVHSFIPYIIGLQKIVPFSVRLQERLALIHIIYKSFVAEVSRKEPKFGI